ncbi:MAG: shikimate dehydrogenase family protein, partial [Anaerolineae bacterium]
VFNRTVERAQELAAAFNLAGAHPLADLPALADYDILVNATSAGYRDPTGSPIPDDWLLPDRIVMDIVPEPLETRLLAAARARGASCVPGWRMRLLQAAAQFRLYTGLEPPLETMQKALLE